jgi:regulator of sigma E protease
VNLGVLNIFPIPVLDGGHLVFLSIEAIRRKPIPFKKRLFWQQVGMALLLLLMVLVTYNDILKLFSGS